MAKLPIEPDLERLRGLSPSIIQIPSGTILHRVYRRGGEHPTIWNTFRHFGPSAARFDHHVRNDEGRPQVQDRGIFYAATDIITAIAEAFQDKRTVNRIINQPWLVSYALATGLTLLDLSDTFPVKAGGSMKLVSGASLYAQNWSRGFYDCYPEIHGIYHPSSLTNRPVVAVYERVASLNPFPLTPQFHRALRDALLIEPIRNACKDIGYDFI